ncbi:MAG: histidine phosphatase family protein [Chloroflexi bacterium]|nr:histidine phosphatase family protein [Chloroflexota bacterium]MCL5274821.1 histidine phosphatase family protein [Chloroflexota bacterium]
MTVLYLIRHARSVGNAMQVIQGWLDLPLDDYGRRQIKLLGDRFQHKALAAIYTSPLLRAADTARAIAEPLGMPVIPDDRLREYHMGAWTGLTALEIEKMMLPRRLDSDLDYVGPGAETGQEMRVRVSSFLDDTLARHAGGSVAVVCHGGTLGGFASAVLGLPPVRRQPFHFGNASVTKFVFEHGRWRIPSMNDRCHLRSLTAGGEVGSQ